MMTLSAETGDRVVTDPDAPYPPISDYALIGDCRTAALVSSHGSIDWMCLPHFSGPSIFAALIDSKRGGRFAVRPAHPFTATRRYIEHTNVLETTFITDSGVLRITDCLPIVDDHAREETLQPQREVLRKVECVSGEVDTEVVFQPRPRYGRSRPHLVRRGALGWAVDMGSETLMLHGDLNLECHNEDTLSGHCRMTVDKPRFLSLTYSRHHIGVISPLGEYAEQRCLDTIQWWRNWCRKNRYQGPYTELVERSALTLKLLTYGLSGAIVAGPTTSLPSVVGGVRNWDYRYCWLRDAALCLSAFVEMGHPGEDQAFLGWLLHSTRLTWPQLQVLYDVYGETRFTESELDHFEGYRGSRPVRIGNGAGGQTQLDVYGEVIAAAYEYVRSGGRLYPEEVRLLQGLGKVVCRQWRETDRGIWEFRDEGRHYTHSKLMCWVALDRLIRLHEQGRIKIPLQRLRLERDAIRNAIEQHAFNPEQGTYVITYGGTEVDASLLLMAHYGYKPVRDPRLLATFQRIDRELGRNGFLYRFPEGYDDFLPPGENPFIITSFWAVEYLALAGEKEKAVARFEKIAACANDLGLFAEEVDPDTGAARGNFPQAFSHVGLINAAFSLEHAQAGRINHAQCIAERR